ncbi:Flagellar biosynthesis protein FlhB [plant metagenome]|uniref:Flagellar biosynthetic protein FlhB n=1 Tax=plant metagenome TaxID=1297885 RepID=A0A484PMC2_9ZZZZ
MADDSDLEKTEPASQRRLEKAREEGQVARSRELVTFLMLVAGVSMLWIGGGAMYNNLRGVMRTSLTFDGRVVTDPGATLATIVNSVLQALMMLVPIFGVLAVTAVLATVAMGGLLLSTKALEPKFGRMNPIKGLARIFSMNTIIELIKTVSKAALIGGIGIWVIWSSHDDMLVLMNAAPTEAMSRAIRLILISCTLIVASLLIIVVLDAPWQIFSHFKKLRMSKEDLRQEYKESEGDPHVKAQIKQLQRQMARRRMMSAVPQADVVVTNPTHYAVALQYREGGTGAPRVVAKGTGAIAARIREIATEHRVPLLEAPALARALHRHVELEQEIPAALYSAVAEVLAWVFQLRAWRSGEGKVVPVEPTGLSVPRELDPLSDRATQGARVS